MHAAVDPEQDLDQAAHVETEEKPGVAAWNKENVTTLKPKAQFDRQNHFAEDFFLGSSQICRSI